MYLTRYFWTLHIWMVHWEPFTWGKPFTWLYEWSMLYSQTHYTLNHVLTNFPLDKMTAIFADDNFKCIFVNENDRIPIRMSLKFVPTSPVDNKPALVQVMAWCRIGDKPLPELMLTQFTDAYMGRWVKLSPLSTPFGHYLINTERFNRRILHPWMYRVSIDVVQNVFIKVP